MDAIFMKQLVITVLDDALVSRITFRFGPVNIAAAGYDAVKAAVQSDRITVVHIPDLGTNKAVYRYTHNQFRLGFTSLGGSADRKALILHEATHAIFDINATRMKEKQSEAAAYIAQCMYFYFLNEAAIRGGATPTFSGNAILTAAWPIAVGAISTPQIADTALAPLFTAIANDRQYNAEADVVFDGVAA
jgi:hypothetical protein